MLIPELEVLVLELSKLPTIGKKTAKRLAFSLIFGTKDNANALASSIVKAKESITTCDSCFGITTSNICSICTDEKRDQSLLCVVESAKDIFTIEDSGAFRGRYHVLQGVINPMKGIAPHDLKIDALISRIKKGSFTEVVLAIHPTIEGEATSHYIIDLLQGEKVKISKIASGIPSGIELEYVNEHTLNSAFNGRNTF